MNKNSNNLNQVNAPVANNIADDEIDLRELLTAIWQGKWIIIAVTTLCAVAAVFYAVNQPNIYKSEALLAPAQQDKAGGLGALGGQLGGLASLAGVNLGSGGGANKTQMALEVLKSRKFTSEFIQAHQILPDIMAVQSWSRDTNQITYDKNLYNKDENKWMREAKAPFKAEPSMQEAYKVFSKLLKANVEPESGLITISIEHQSPYIAKQWVTWLIEDINLEMKTRDVNEANKSTDFLMTQLENTRIADIRIVLYKLVEEQAKTIMFANVRDEYVFKTIDPAIIPEQKFKPKRALVCIFGVLIGAMFGVIIVLVRHFLKKD